MLPFVSTAPLWWRGAQFGASFRGARAWKRGTFELCIIMDSLIYLIAIARGLGPPESGSVWFSAAKAVRFWHRFGLHRLDSAFVPIMEMHGQGLPHCFALGLHGSSFRAKPWIVGMLCAPLAVPMARPSAQAQPRCCRAP